METYSNLPFKTYELVEKPTVEYEYQDLILQCVEYFGKEKEGLLWSLPFKPKHTERIIRDSLKICMQNGKDIKYFLGILRNKTK